MKHTKIVMVVVLFFAIGSSAFAQRILVDRKGPRIPQQVRLVNYELEVKIMDRVAIENHSMTFYNPNNWQIAEGDFLMDISPKAQVEDLTMMVNGKKMKAELVDAEKARRIYQSIVNRRKDPALLEYYNWKLIRARVFPIPANGNVEIEIRLSKIMEAEGNSFKLVTLAIPKNQSRTIPWARPRIPRPTPLPPFPGPIPETPEKERTPTPKQISLKVVFKADITCQKPIKNIYSPTHRIDVMRKDEHNARISFEEEKYTVKNPFILYYDVSEKDIGLGVIAYRLEGEKGFFMLMLSPKVQIDESKLLAKDVIFCFDTSGSMSEGGKIDQAKNALKFCINALNSKDRFNIIDFSTEAREFSAGLVEATSENKEKAIRYINKLEARGGTAIEEALLKSLGMFTKTDRPRMIVFMTDGTPTIGERNIDRLLAIVKDKNENVARIFVFGVGHDVNTKLLDLLAEDNSGTCDYILPEEDIEKRIGGFYEKISYPVLSDLSIKFADLKVNDMYPKRLPDIFKGQQLVIFGRYEGDGHKLITLTGNVMGKEKVYTYEINFPADSEEADFVPRLWAGRKVAYLLDEIKRRGTDDELVKEIVRLAKKYGIVTPYTSYLITEDMPVPTTPGRMEQAQIRRFRRAMDEDEAQGFAGREAVEKAKDVKYLKAPPAACSRGGGGGLDKLAEKEYRRANRGRGGTVAEKMQTIGSKTFYFSKGVWYDSIYGGDASYPSGTVITITFGSTEYFKLIQENPGIARYLALGEEVIVCYKRKVYKIVKPKKEKEEEKK